MIINGILRRLLFVIILIISVQTNIKKEKINKVLKNKNNITRINRYLLNVKKIY